MPQARRIETRPIETRPDLVFDVSVAGDAAAPLVLLLHGFGVSRHLYDAQLPALAAAGYLAAAPDQRGYSPGARPDPTDRAQYDIELLIPMRSTSPLRWAMAGAASTWSGMTGAAACPGRSPRGTRSGWPRLPCSPARIPAPSPAPCARSGAADPVPPPQGLPRAGRGPQLLADDAAWLRIRHPPRASRRRDREASRGARQPAAMAAALAWYRARGTVHRPIPRITVPTLFIWGDDDDTVGRMAAEGTADFIDAPYQPVDEIGSGLIPFVREW